MIRHRRYRLAPLRPRFEPLEVRTLLSIAGAVSFSFGNVDVADVAPQSLDGENGARASGRAVIATQADGGILDATFVTDEPQRPNLIAIDRLDADGHADPTFGRSGQASVESDLASGNVSAVLVRPDGAIDVVVVSGLDGGLDPATGPEVVQLLPDGTLDPSFGTGGIARYPAAPGGDMPAVEATSAALQADGKILLAGGRSVTRIDLDGSLDAAFIPGDLAVPGDSGGTVDIPIEGVISGVAVQPVGRIVVAGNVTAPTASGGVFAAALNPDGSPDEAYGKPVSEGVVILPPNPLDPTEPGSDDLAQSALGPDGSLVLLEDVKLDDDPFDSGKVLVRLAPDGKLDPTFGDGGFDPIVEKSRFADLDLGAGGILVQPDGKIVLSDHYGRTTEADELGPVEYHEGNQVSRFDADGAVDTTFDNFSIPQGDAIPFGSGTVANPGVAIGNLALQPGGSIIQVIWFGSSSALIRFDGTTTTNLNALGELDPNFGGGDGYVLDTTFQQRTAGGTSLPDGRVVLVTPLDPTQAQSGPVLERIGLDGKPDPSFGLGGKVVEAALEGQEIDRLVAQPDGKLVAFLDPEDALVRFNPDGTLDPSFGQGGLARLSAPSDSPNGFSPIDSLVAGPDGKLLVVTQGGGNGSPSTVEIRRWDADGSPDTTFGQNGSATLALPSVPSPYYLDEPRVALQADGQIILALSSIDIGSVAPIQGMVVIRLRADGTPDPAFGQGGTDVIPVQDSVLLKGVASGPDGRIVLEGDRYIRDAGGVEQYAAAVRLDDDGSVDAGFGDSGVVSLPVGAFDPIYGSGGPFVRPDGTIVIAGIGSDGQPALATVLPTGGSEVIDYQFGPAQADTEGLFIEPDGSALLLGIEDLPTGFSPEDPNDDLGRAVYVAHILLPARPGLGYPGSPPDPTPPQSPDPITPPTGLAGGLDPGYAGGTGYEAFDLGNPGALTLAGTDGRIDLAGFGAGRVVARRYNPDGSIDATDKGGEIAVAGSGQVEAMALQPDGKLLVDGIVRVGGRTEAFLVRFDADGSPDLGFGVAGALVFALGSDVDGPDFDPRIGAIDLQADGKILLAGEAAETSGVVDLAAVRVDADGTLDPSFHRGGILMVPVPGGVDINATTLGIKALTDGQILLAGTANRLVEGIRILEEGDQDAESIESPDLADIVVVRIDADGEVDPTFGAANPAISPTPGLVLIGANTDFYSYPRPASSFTFDGLALDSNGGVIVEGTYGDGLGLVRLDGAGTVDRSFGTNGAGLARLSLAGSDTFTPTGAFAIENYLQIVVAGYDKPGGQVELARFTASGAPDPTFGDSTTVGLEVEPIAASDTPTLSLTLIAGDVALLSGTILTDRPTLVRYPAYALARVLLYPTFESPTPTPTPSPTPTPTPTPSPTPTPTPSPTPTPTPSPTPTPTPTPSPTPTPIPTPPIHQPPANFDGSGRTNLATYDAADGVFLLQPSTGGPFVTTSFGVAGPGQTLPAPGDYTGAGHAEIAAYIPSQGVYAIRPADGSADIVVPFGIPGAGQSIPAPGDYEGTGRDDIAVYMPSIGAFGIRPSAGGPDQIVPFGIPGTGQSLPAPADYFGTGQDDIAVYLAQIGAFAIRNPVGGADQIVPFGRAGIGQSIPIPGDYDGSGPVELAVYMPATGQFAYRPYGGGPDVVEAFGTANDGSIPLPGDYTGSGHDEIAVYDPNYAAFAYRPAGGGPDVVQVFGTVGLSTSLLAAAPAGAISGEIQAVAETSASAQVSAASGPGGPAVKATSMTTSRRPSRSVAAQAMSDRFGTKS